MAFLEKVSKSFLCGATLASVLAVAGLVIYLIVLAAGPHRQGTAPDGSGSSSKKPIDGSSEESDALNPLRLLLSTHLGFYRKAAVSVDAEPCAKIATDVLRRNGSAVDAAVAALFCTGAVHSMSMGLGGGFVMTAIVGGERLALVAREMAPLAATRDMYVNRSEASTKGPLAIAVPGEVLGYHAAKERLGNPAVSWKSLVQPTIDLCENGIPVTRTIAKYFESRRDRIMNNTEFRKVFVDPKTNETYKEGETYKRPTFARTLRAIAANGSDEFYRGRTADMMIEDLKEAGGIITKEDLKNYNVSWEKPAEVNLANGMTVLSSPPPASGAVTAAILGVMSHFDHGAVNSSVAAHRFVEACKYGFAKRSSLGDWSDPDIREKVKKIVDEATSTEWHRIVRHSIKDDWTSQDPDYYGADYADVEDGGTTHISVLAPNGDAVSVTSTINTLFGSFVMSGKTGVIFNNEMDDFSTPGVPNYFGIYPSEANFIKPGRRPVSSMSPTIVTDGEGKVRLVVGASGGSKIITATAWTAALNLWFRRNIKEAILQPRVHHQLLPMYVRYENMTDGAVVDYLRRAGHEVKKMPRGSNVQAVSVEAPGIVTANNDWAKAGSVDGF